MQCHMEPYLFAWLFLLHGHFKPIPWLRADITFLAAGLLQANEFQKHRKHSHVVYCQESMCVCDSMPQIVRKIIPCNIPKAIILSNFCISLYISALRPNNYGEIRANPDPSSTSRDLLQTKQNVHINVLKHPSKKHNYVTIVTIVS